MKIRLLKCLFAVFALLLSSGCMQISCVVRLDENGGGRVTEVLGFSARVLQLETRLTDGKTRKIAELLTEARVKERAKLMGPDVTVESWKVEDTTEGGKQLTAVYRFKDINKIVLCAYPLGPNRDMSSLKFEYSVSAHPKKPVFSIKPILIASEKDIHPLSPKAKTIAPVVSEQELQQVRQLLPIFKDMLKGFKLSVKLEVYEQNQWATITKGLDPCGFQNHISLTGGRETLLEVSDTDLINNDEALMLLAAWREPSYDSIISLLSVPWVGGGLYGASAYSWARLQHAETREYY